MFVGKSRNVHWGSWHRLLQRLNPWSPFPRSPSCAPVLFLLCQCSALLTLPAVGGILSVFNFPSMSQILYPSQLEKGGTFSFENFLLTLCDLMDYTVHGILQARILEWVAILFSRGSSQPRDQTQASHIADRFFTSWATGETWRKEHWPEAQTYLVTFFIQ